MPDIAQQLLMNALAASNGSAQARGQAVWVVDEQFDPASLTQLQPRAGLIAISNRCDVFHALQGRGYTALLTDFSFEPWGENSLDVVAYRISKEKAVVHHIINAALERLQPGGELWLTGGKKEGIKTYLEKAAQRAQGTLQIERHGTVWSGVITRGASLGAPLDDQRYGELREMVSDDGLSIWSKPGIYGWQKIDVGSQLLADQLTVVWPQTKMQPPQRILDIGCGYGYLSMRAAQLWPQASIVATDNNITATFAAEKNLANYRDRAEVVLADCAYGIDGSFDAVICNPPFHQGFDVEDELTARFLKATRNHLTKHGRALFVVNQFIPIERKAQPLFRQVREICRDHGFKIIELQSG